MTDLHAVTPPGTSVTAREVSPGERPTEDELSHLVALAQQGDTVAFELLVHATHRETYTMALRLTGCPEDARDVTQEAYFRAYKGLAEFRGDARFSTWMYRITANAASTYLGRRRRHRHDELPDVAQLADPRHDLDPALVADAGDLRDRLVTALDDLPPKLRAVVVLRDVYEMPHDDIAEELGISVTAAKVRLHRARHRLRSELFPDLDQVARVRCDQVSPDLSAIADGTMVPAPDVRAHVEHCLRCQAEMVQYRRVLRVMRSLRSEVLEPAPGLLPDVLAAIEEAGERHAVRSLVSRHRLAYVGGLAAATAAGAAGAIVIATRSRRNRPALAG